jgi:hypothetical protein
MPAPLRLLTEGRPIGDRSFDQMVSQRPHASRMLSQRGSRQVQASAEKGAATSEPTDRTDPA